jgi:alpha-methylacyl-CoA racemase
MPDHVSGPLSDVRVIDLSRLAPGPYATMLLADLGADVIVVGGGRSGLPLAEVSRGKRFISLDLKQPAGRDALHRLVATADVVVEGFRPGVAARLGAGYEELSAVKPDLLYCSLTGYGQDGPLAQEAGHDINYLSVTGVLGSLGPSNAPPVVPLNLIADFAGGSLLAAFGIVAALYERRLTGQGQYLDVAMVDGVRSMMAMHYSAWGSSAMPRRGEGILDGTAPFYRCYATADDRYVAVGALEPQFFRALWERLGLGEVPAQYPRAQWPAIEQRLTAAFRTRTRDEWTDHFVGTDACVTPVLDPGEVAQHPHMAFRHGQRPDADVPPVPRLSRTPAVDRPVDASDATAQVLAEIGIGPDEIDAARDRTVPAGLAGWPAM